MKHLEPHGYWIYYVNIELCHRYGVSVAESWTFLLVGVPGGGEWGRMSVFAGLL